MEFYGKQTTKFQKNWSQKNLKLQKLQKVPEISRAYALKMDENLLLLNKLIWIFNHQKVTLIPPSAKI